MKKILKIATFLFLTISAGHSGANYEQPIFLHHQEIKVSSYRLEFNSVPTPITAGELKQLVNKQLDNQTEIKIAGFAYQGYPIKDDTKLKLSTLRQPLKCTHFSSRVKKPLEEISRSDIPKIYTDVLTHIPGLEATMILEVRQRTGLCKTIAPNREELHNGRDLKKIVTETFFPKKVSRLFGSTHAVVKDEDDLYMHLSENVIFVVFDEEQ